MNLHDALTILATQHDLLLDDLVGFADDAPDIGYHSDPQQSTAEIGSLWRVEGQVLYALIRATQPSVVVELGTHKGASTMHILEALKANGSGKLITVDHDSDWTPPRGYKKLVDVIKADAVTWVQEEMPSRKVGLLYEDLEHSAEQVEAVWSAAIKKVLKGAIILSHDAAHPNVGAAVREGIANAGATNVHVLDIAPSDCGLAVWLRD